MSSRRKSYGIKVGDGMECPVTGQALGTVIEINRDTNTVAVKRATKLEQPACAMAEKNDEPQVKAACRASTPDFGLTAGAPD